VTDEISVRVHPTLLPEESVLARVSGVFNAISVSGDVVGTTVYIGRGAGQDATASAVISDITDAVALLLHGKGAHIMGEEIPRAARGARMAPPERIRGRYYVRLTVADRPGVLARVATIMARNRMSIASVIQNPAEREGSASLVLTTHESDERSMRVALRSLAGLGSVREKPLLLRIGDLGD
jgi:homoserine dehydrogenase